MTLSNGIFSALLALCEGNPPVTGGFPSQRTVTRNLMFSLIGVWTNGWTNKCDAGDLKRHGTHYEVTVMEAPDLNIHKPASPSCWGKCWMRVFCWSNFAAQYVFIHVLLLFVMEHLRSWTRTEIHIFFSKFANYNIVGTDMRNCLSIVSYPVRKFWFQVPDQQKFTTGNQLEAKTIAAEGRPKWCIHLIQI